MKTALVTGGLGFIGSNLAKELARQGHRVIVVDNGNDEVHALRRQSMYDYPNIDFYDVDCGGWLIETLFANEKPNWVFHLAAIPRIGECEANPGTSTTNNVAAVAHLLALSAKYGVESFVFSSSSSVYGVGSTFSEDDTPSPENLYGWHKLMGEQLCYHFQSKNPSMRVICLRYFNVYGPGQYETGSYATAVGSWLNCIRKGEALRKDGSGEQRRDMVYVDDVVNANIIAASIIPEDWLIANVGTGKSISNTEVLKMLESRFGNLNILQAPERPSDIPETKANPSHFSGTFGWVPSTPFEEGLDKTIKWMRLKTQADAAK